MKACVLESPGPVETNPLILSEVPVPEPGPDEVLVRVNACGVCRTDLARSGRRTAAAQASGYSGAPSGGHGGALRLGGAAFR